MRRFLSLFQHKLLISRKARTVDSTVYATMLYQCSNKNCAAEN